MNDFLKHLPDEIFQLAERCRAHVQKRFSLELDFTGDTLSVLDFFVEELVKDENRGVAPLPGHSSRMNMIHLFAPTMGAYLGALLCRHFGGRFRHTEQEISKWRFEFDTFFVRFNPVAIAASVIAKQEVDGLPVLLISTPSLSQRLQERFDAAPEIPEDEFFSFCNFFESIQIANEFLIEVSRKDGKMNCSSENYDLLLGDR